MSFPTAQSNRGVALSEPRVSTLTGGLSRTTTTCPGVFHAGIYNHGVLLGFVPICNGGAGYFEPVEEDDFLSAVLRDRM